MGLRVLYMVSSIGLGHIARSRSIAEALRLRGASVEFVAPPPTFEYLEAWGWRYHPVSRELEPIAPVVNKHYIERDTGAITLGLALKEYRIAERNARRIADALDPGAYDGIVADESWELLASPWIRKPPTPLVLVTDFLVYEPWKGSLLAALAFNRFMDKRLPLFDRIIFVGFEEKIPRESSMPSAIRWILGRVRRGLRVDAVGLVPPVLPHELMEPREARRILGLPEEGPLVLVSMGGTAGGYRILSRVAFVLKSAPGSPVAVFAPGATADLEAPRGARVIRGPLRYRLPALVRAFDAMISNAGLSTIALAAATGTPTVVIPLRRHFEQEENASLASRRWSFIHAAPPTPSNDEILELVSRALGSRGEPDRSLYDNIYAVADSIIDAIAAGIS